MITRDLVAIIGGRVICGNDKIDREVAHAFASDLMSDVLTLDKENILLITGLANMQTIRTAEMSDISCILFVRNKKVTDEMIDLAEENNMILIQCASSMFKTVGELYVAGLKPVY